VPPIEDAKKAALREVDEALAKLEAEPGAPPGASRGDKG